ncbi:MAG: hypothetical protein UZ22_OP11002001130 [Microgenomates bacterium OLB23]|nr:MAG: hypothetical protein UZ22_OP11002001130 [Microgenomates bacterium OLB23]
MAKTVPGANTKLQKILTIGGVLILLSAMISSLIFFYLYTQEAKKNAINDATRTLEAVSKLMELPTDETPTVATVTDKTKLQKQPLFNKAENDDRVIIYTKAQKAILYRPSINKIIEVAPVNTIAPSPANNKPTNAIATASATVTPSNKEVKAILLNGTKKVGLTNELEKLLIATFSNITVIDKDDAKNKSYEKTLVVIVNTDAKNEAEEIAKKLNANVQTLPKDEQSTSEADIVIIVGEDRI